MRTRTKKGVTCDGSGVGPGCLLSNSHWRFSGHVTLAGNTSGSLRRDKEALLGRETTGIPCLICCHCNQNSREVLENGWMEKQEFKNHFDIMQKWLTNSQLVFKDSESQYIPRSGGWWSVTWLGLQELRAASFPLTMFLSCLLKLALATTKDDCYIYS